MESFRGLSYHGSGFNLNPSHMRPHRTESGQKDLLSSLGRVATMEDSTRLEDGHGLVFSPTENRTVEGSRERPGILRVCPPPVSNSSSHSQVQSTTVRRENIMTCLYLNLKK